MKPLNIVSGERVLEYKVKGEKDGDWIDLSSGTNIGHKHIDKFQPQSVSEIKLEITKSKTVPQIKNFAIFEADK
jgi:alpha-L-fucosidase